MNYMSECYTPLHVASDCVGILFFATDGFTIDN